MIKAGQTFEDIENYKDEDGFLYLNYYKLETFGN